MVAEALGVQKIRIRFMMIKRLFSLFFFWGALPLWLSAQSTERANHWYFGYNAGLDFSTGNPKPVSDGALNIWEGCSSISDPNGKLLFYTDGRSVWNRKHQLIPNAINLGGHNSTTQSGTIVPQPENPYLYYIFSIDVSGGPGGLQYAVLDMRLNNGLGGLISKNNLLLANSSESLTVIRHCNETDYWVLAHEVGNNVFKAFPVTKNGLNVMPVVSKAGAHSRGSLGYMKVSPNRKKVAIASFNSDTFEILQFNSKLGVLSGPLSITHPSFQHAYGLEFSPDNRFLYIASTLKGAQQIYQLDLLSPNAASLLQSRTLIGEISDSHFGALQLGPDHKIYVAINDADYVGVIRQPNVKGVQCRFVEKGVPLAGKKSGIGLPNFIADYFNAPPVVVAEKTTEKTCNDVVLTAKISTQTSDYSYQWFLEDKKITGATKVNMKPARSGKYRVSIREIGQCTNDSLNSEALEVKILEAKPEFINLGCNRVTLKANANATIKWVGNGISAEQARQDTLTVSGQGTQVYTLQVFYPGNSGCYIEKELKVTFSAAGIYDFGKASITDCDSAALDAPVLSKWHEYAWLRPDRSVVSSSKIVGSQSGEYIIKVTDTTAHCTAMDTVRVTIHQSPIFIPDEKLCLANNFLVLKAGASGKNLVYEWSPYASPNATITTSKAGKYQVKATTPEGCSSFRSIEVVAPQKIDIGKDITVCEGETVELSPIVANAESSILYEWSSGQHERTIHPQKSGVYTLTTRQNVCVISDSVRVTIHPLPQIKPDETVCLNKGIDAGGLESNLTYFWPHSAETTPSIALSEEGVYKVTVTNRFGCAAVRTITVNEPCVPRIYAPDVFTPNQDGINDVFKLIVVSGQAVGLSIYNRWGQVIFADDQASPQWDGKFGGDLCPEGNYLYVFRYKTRHSDAVVEYHGTILLQR